MRKKEPCEPQTGSFPHVIKPSRGPRAQTLSPEPEGHFHHARGSFTSLVSGQACLLPCGFRLPCRDPPPPRLRSHAEPFRRREGPGPLPLVTESHAVTWRGLGCARRGVRKPGRLISAKGLRPQAGVGVGAGGLGRGEASPPCFTLPADPRARRPGGRPSCLKGARDWASSVSGRCGDAEGCVGHRLKTFHWHRPGTCAGLGAGVVGVC